MKKLMIAAAAVAMIGAAEATTFVYDFSASLKTTNGKMGKVTKTPYTVNLGQDVNGKFWWDSKTIKNYLGYKFENAAAGKAWLKTLKTDAEKEAFAAVVGFNDDAYAGNVGKNEFGYKVKNGNKQAWCTTFKYTHVDDGACYRVAASKTLKGRIYVDDCCEFGEGNYNSWFLYIDGVAADYLNNWMFLRFGAQTLAKANKVEYIGSFGVDVSNRTLEDFWNDPRPAGNTGAHTYQPLFVFAGQGDWAANLYDNEKGVKNISGNIVGSLPAPTCESCCDYSADAIVFLCDAEDDDDIAWQKKDRGIVKATAAFGTWSMKFNKKLTQQQNP